MNRRELSARVGKMVVDELDRPPDRLRSTSNRKMPRDVVRGPRSIVGVQLHTRYGEQITPARASSDHPVVHDLHKQ